MLVGTEFLSVLPIIGTFLLPVTVYNVLQWSARSRKFPPGPCLPVLDMGNGTQDAANDPSIFLTWYRKWGEVASFRFAHVLFVVANTGASISQMLVKNGGCSSGRFRSTVQHPLFVFREGIIEADGDEWRQRRSFILSMFRHFGFSKYEASIVRECEYMIEQFKQFDGKIINPLLPVNSAVSNVIYQLLFGERMDRNEMETFEDIIRRINDMMTDEVFNNSFLLQMLGNAAYYLPGDVFHVKRQYKNLSVIGEYFNTHIQRQRSMKSIGSGEPINFLDACLRDSKFTDMEIRSTLLDLLSAGMETVTTTLHWALLLMAMYPDVQSKVRDEIREHFENKTPTYSDRYTLVYTKAVLHEVERFVTVVPMSIPHMATSDFTLNGYLIPKGALLLPNLYAAHHDEKVWPHAHAFNPANFYDDSTKSLKNLEHLIPFSVGRRSCLGETLAKQEMFIFFAGLLQNFEITESNDHPLPPLNVSTVGIVRCPRPFAIVVNSCV